MRSTTSITRRAALSLAAIATAATTAVAVSPAAHAAYTPTNDYPFKNSDGGVHWGFYDRQCTSFAAWRVRHNRGHDNFTNYYRGAHFGNANTWDEAARQIGLRVDQTPNFGDIAVSNAGSAGHVAFVARVNADGSFLVEEYNWATPRGYGKRTVNVGPNHGQFSHFITFPKR
jgi:surface antigen